MYLLALKKPNITLENWNCYCCHFLKRTMTDYVLYSKKLYQQTWMYVLWEDDWQSIMSTWLYLHTQIKGQPQRSWLGLWQWVGCCHVWHVQLLQQSHRIPCAIIHIKYIVKNDSTLALESTQSDLISVTASRNGTHCPRSTQKDDEHRRTLAKSKEQAKGRLKCWCLLSKNFKSNTGTCVPSAVWWAHSNILFSSNLHSILWVALLLVFCLHGWPLVSSPFSGQADLQSL